MDISPAKLTQNAQKETLVGNVSEKVGGKEEEQAARTTDTGGETRCRDTLAGNFPGLKRNGSDWRSISHGQDTFKEFQNC